MGLPSEEGSPSGQLDGSLLQDPGAQPPRQATLSFLTLRNREDRNSCFKALSAGVVYYTGTEGNEHAFRGGQNKGPNVSTSYSPEPGSMSPEVAKGPLQG